MRYLWIMCALLWSISSLSAAEEKRQPKFNTWFTWKSSAHRGKITRVRPGKELPQGAVRFDSVAGSGIYSASTYGNEKVSPDKNVRIIVGVKYSTDVNSDVRVTLSLRGKVAGGGWYAPFDRQVKPPRRAVFPVKPGKMAYASVEVNLADYKLPDLAMICPFVSVGNLNSGSVTACKSEFYFSDKSREPAPVKAVAAPAKKADSVIGNMTVRKGAFKEFQWPATINWDNFKRQMDYTALGLNIIELTPEMQGAAVIWKDDRAVEARYLNGKWILANGRKGDMTVAAEISSSNLVMACCGTAVIFRDDSGKYTFVVGGLENSGASLMLPQSVATPNVKQIYIGGYGILYSLADNAQQELERAMKLFDENESYIKAHWNNRSKVWLWGQRIDFYRSSLEKVKKECIEQSDGFLPAIAADPVLRDRYSWLIWMLNGQYSSTGGYFGGEFRKNYYQFYSGRGEVAEALRFAQRVQKLAARARRIKAATFTEGKAIDKILSAGWASSLSNVPRKAGLPQVSSTGKLRLAQGEGESIMLVLSSALDGVDNIRVKAAAKSANAPQIKLYEVKYVSMEATGSPHLPLTPGGDEEVADVCVPVSSDTQLSLPGYSNQPILVNVIADEKALPGKYLYECTVSAGGKSMTLPLEVTVDGFNPGYKRLASVAGLSNREINTWYAPELRKTAKLNLSEALLECKIMPLTLYEWGAPSPYLEDIPRLMKKGLDGVMLSSGMQGVVDPDADTVKFVELYGSKDGKVFEKIPAEVKFIARKGKAIDAQDLLVTPKVDVKKYRCLKVHNTKQVDVRKQYCQSFLMRKDSKPYVEVVYKDGKRTQLSDEVRYIQPDKNPKTSTFAQGKVIQTLFFDNYVARNNRASVMIENAGGDIASIRLFNNRASVISANIKYNYQRVRKIVGKDMPIYVYGFDEATEYENERMRKAMIRVKKLAPGIKLVTTACNIKADMDLYKLLDIHCPCNAYFIPRLYREVAQKYGTTFWTYVGGGGYYPFGNFERVDQPLINTRAFFWSMICFDYISGYLYWDINMWSKNKSLASEKVFDWSKWDSSHGDYNGMGALFYPGAEGVIYPSLRSWSMRDGVEDVNIYRYAGELLKKYPDAAKEQELSVIGQGIARSMSVWCKDAGELANLRERLYNLINSIDKK